MLQRATDIPANNKYKLRTPGTTQHWGYLAVFIKTCRFSPTWFSQILVYVFNECVQVSVSEIPQPDVYSKQKVGKSNNKKASATGLALSISAS